MIVKTFFMNQTLTCKQISILLFVGLVPMLVAAYLADIIAEKEISKQAYGQLEFVRDIKAEALERYFTTPKEQLLNEALLLLLARSAVWHNARPVQQKRLKI